MKTNWETTARLLSKELGYRFSDLKLLKAAMTHRSSAGVNNERLEFLGDSILNFSIAVELYTRFPKAQEGDLTRLRAVLVNGATVAEIAKELGIGEHLSLGLGELKTGGFQRESILADALEAIIAAIYLDSSEISVCQERILAWYESRLTKIVPGTSPKDAKTALQEYLQSKHLALPEYEVIATTGSSHQPLFKVLCRVPVLATPIEGVANTRKKAEQNAAEATLKAIKNDTR